MSSNPSLTDTLAEWPVVKQALGAGEDEASTTGRTRRLRSRLAGVESVGSICPYCAVGCATLVHLKDGRVVSIEGDPESPINEGTLCPKGANTFQYTINPRRLTKALYRRPYGTEWEEVELEWAMDRIAERFRDTRDRTYRATDEEGRSIRQTPGIAFLGGAALDNEENYLIKKFAVGAGVVHVENQARI